MLDLFLSRAENLSSKIVGPSQRSRRSAAIDAAASIRADAPIAFGL